MRILGLDYGSKTVGVAVSDELLFTAQGLEIVRRQSPNKLRQSLARIEEIIKEYNVERIVLGYPKNMNNTEGERCEKTKEFKTQQCVCCQHLQAGRYGGCSECDFWTADDQQMWILTEKHCHCGSVIGRRTWIYPV